MLTKTGVIIYIAIIMISLCVVSTYSSTDKKGVNSISQNDGTQWAPLLDQTNTVTQSLDGRTIVRYTHSSRSEWRYKDPKDKTFYVVAPKKPREHAPLYVVLHSANRTAFDYLGYQFLNRKVAESDNPSDVVTHVPDDFYGLFLNSDNDEWWGWGMLRSDTAKYTDELTPAEKRILDSIEWVVKHYKVDRNRIYLCGVSMGGSGSLGIGLPHGDIFAAIRVWVPAGADHFANRMGYQPTYNADAHPLKMNIWKKEGLPDPPPVVDIFGENDVYLQTQDIFRDAAVASKFSFVSGWGSFGHYALVSRIGAYPQCEAAQVFPWLEIRKNEAYPVFTNATSDQRPPRYDTPENKSYDKDGQINAFFRWKNKKDSHNQFTMQLWMEYPKNQSDNVKIQSSAVADVVFRRLQRFKIQPGKTYIWQIISDHKVLRSGNAVPDSENLLTIPQVTVTSAPVQISLKVKS